MARVAFELREDVRKDFSGATANVAGGVGMVDLGELLESGSGKIVLEPDAVLGKNGEPSDEERERALREEHIANALDYHPAFKRAAVEAESGSKSSGKAAK